MKIFKAINGEIAINPSLRTDKVYNLYYADKLCFTCIIKSISLEYILFDILISSEDLATTVSTFYSIHYPEKGDKVQLIPLVEDKTYE